MPNKCTKCGNTENYNFALNIGLCDVCIGERLEELETENKAILRRAEAAEEDWQAAEERIIELEAKLEQHRWIPINESLPVNVATVFILTGEGVIGVGFYEKGWERLDHTINLNITHWKPVILP